MSSRTFTVKSGDTEYYASVATIKSTRLGPHEHYGVWNALLTLENSDKTWLGTGDWVLDHPVHNDEGKFLGRYGTSLGMQYIMELMNVVGVSKWEDMVGQTVLVLTDDKGFRGEFRGLANLKDESRVLIVEEFFENEKKRENVS